TDSRSGVQDRRRFPALLQRLVLVGGPLDRFLTRNPTKGPTDQLRGPGVPEFSIEDLEAANHFRVGVFEYGDRRAVVPNGFVPALLPPFLGGRCFDRLVHQYSSGSRNVVAERSASVMIQMRCPVGST